ncbi:hypothetical protein [Bacillus sp. SD088]|uniref:hypothetical protein n=1 Tax=Bacillus sp. SD088 TaxID=2782012 RepID=UPI001A96F1EB|nr:hypothetical protein [Bacillus sp. SD088]MBO0994378.1 hypothetical protein [Bacillus sp. SD088]
MKINKNRYLVILMVLIGIIVISSFFIPKETKPSPSTRVIIDNTYRTYIAPMCFDKADVTNWIDETSLKKAKELNYKPHSSCTENALKGEKDTLFTSILGELGILENKWRNW